MPAGGAVGGPRVVLLTGKGGVGKSTVAAGTAALAAAAGRRTLLVSTDPAHSLADALDVEVGDEPTPVEPGLWAQQVDTQDRLQRAWGEVRGYLLDALGDAGVDPVTAEELTVVPGAEEILALLELRRHLLEGWAGESWDVVVVDCAPTGETLRLLALPEVLGWYLERLLPSNRRVLRALRPLLERTSDLPVPGADVARAVDRLRVELGEVRELLARPGATVRLVMTPESVVLAEARRAWTALSLFGYRVDGVVANRVFPTDAADPWRRGWVAAQDAVLAAAAESFADLPLWRAPYAPGEPVGVAAVRSLARDLYGDDDPLAVPRGAGPLRVVTTTAGPELRLAVPLATRADVDLARSGDELVVTVRAAGGRPDDGHDPDRRAVVGSWRRLLSLPVGLARLRVVGAAVEHGELRVRFAGTDAEAAGTTTEGEGTRRDRRR